MPAQEVRLAEFSVSTDAVSTYLRRSLGATTPPPTFIHTMPKLFIPGPVEVSEKTFRAMCRPMIGHRSGDFKKLYGGIQPRLKELFGTTQPVFLSTSSAWGVMAV